MMNYGILALGENFMDCGEEEATITTLHYTVLCLHYVVLGGIMIMPGPLPYCLAILMIH